MQFSLLLPIQDFTQAINFKSPSTVEVILVRAGLHIGWPSLPARAPDFSQGVPSGSSFYVVLRTPKLTQPQALLPSVESKHCTAQPH
jgi:hypothetical protein